MLRELGSAGCGPSAAKHRPVASVELITTAALALSTVVAVTAVSIGIARADVVGSVAKGASAPFAIAVFIGLLLSGMGGLTALMASDERGNSSRR
jgi:F0F1-type ATP synthase membrane subunit a